MLRASYMRGSSLTLGKKQMITSKSRAIRIFITLGALAALSIGASPYTSNKIQINGRNVYINTEDESVVIDVDTNKRIKILCHAVNAFTIVIQEN
jgi:hypothetical protein